MNSQRAKRPSGWHEQQTSCQPAASLRFLMDVGENELAMKVDIIFAVGCAELSPAHGVRRFKFAVSDGACWNIEEFMCKIASFCVINV